MGIKLETKRLILRKPTIADYYFFLKELKKREIAERFNIYHPLRKRHFIVGGLKVFGLILSGNKFHSFAIRLKTEKKTIGQITLMDVKENKIGIMSFWISKNYRKKGYMLESNIAINNFVFNNLRLRKLNSHIFQDNLPSRKIHEKLGYRLEGTLREDFINRATDKIKDDCCYGLLKSEWKKIFPVFKKNLKKKF